MSRTQRLTLLGLAAAVLVIAIVIAVASGGDDDSPSATPTTTAPASSTARTTTTTSAPSKPATPRIVIRDGKPVGGVQKLTFQKGGTIAFVVASDTADEVHFHGYDVAKDVDKGGSVRFSVPAKIDGRFIVELEQAHETIANVTVEP